MFHSEAQTSSVPLSQQAGWNGGRVEWRQGGMEAGWNGGRVEWRQGRLPSGHYCLQELNVVN